MCASRETLAPRPPRPSIDALMLKQDRTSSTVVKDELKQRPRGSVPGVRLEVSDSTDAAEVRSQLRSAMEASAMGRVIDVFRAWGEHASRDDPARIHYSPSRGASACPPLCRSDRPPFRLVPWLVTSSGPTDAH